VIESLKFGLLYSFQSPPEIGTPHSQLYQEAFKEAELAEKLGYDSIFLIEHHFLQDGFNPSLMVTAAAFASRTQSIAIGTSCYLLTLHHPIETAENAAVVDNISNGRLILGVAAAYRDEEFRGFGLNRVERGARMDEYLQILKEAWSRDSFSFKGRFYSCEDLSVTPKPIQRPIPLWFGASGEAGLRRAARNGIPLVASNRHHLSELEEHYKTYRSYLEKFGKKVDVVPVLRNTYVADTEEKAVNDARDPIMRILGGMYGKWSRWRPIKDDKGRTPDDPTFFEFESHKEKNILGGPKDVVRQIETYKERLGMNYLLCWMAMPGMPHKNVEESMKIFAKDVMPSFH
jgi:alkanesulfonate monooxygenase SsuD/methylene tetrahydromethanopterin reductase-like flavin-dependent oxidoreductase (luciferase family)